MESLPTTDCFGFTKSELEGAGAVTTPSDSDSEEVSLGVQELTVQHEEAANTARDSLDFLAAIAMPLIYEYAFPPIFLGVWQWLTSYAVRVRDFSRLALGLPRGFGKTMVIKLFVLWCILFTQKRFILVLAENLDKAINIVADVFDMLEEDNIKGLFGDWKTAVETDTQKMKKFNYRGRDIIVLAAGAGTGIRGITVKNRRPDIMIFDDIQSREDADSKEVSDKLLRWLSGTAMKAKSPQGCLFLFIGNMYPTPHALLKKIKHDPVWLKFICGGILQDGTSLWEELQPIEQLKQELLSDLSIGTPEIFYAEVLNDENASVNNIVDLSNLPPLPCAEGDIPAGNFVIIDPANNKENSDAVAIGYCEVFDGYPVLQKLTSDKLSPGDTIRTALNYCLTKGCSLVVIEGVAYQASLGYWFQFICAQLGITGITCVEIYPGGTSKNSRIIKSLKAYAKGELFVSDECRPLIHTQAAQFNPLKSNNIDDCLDVMHYMPKVLAEFGDLVASSSIIQSTEHEELEVADETVTCLF